MNALLAALLVAALATIAALALHLRRVRAAATARSAELAARTAERIAAERAQAAAAEREQIYDDLHDDLGAKLLQMIYEAPSPQQADQARALLQDLRDVVTRSRGAAGTLDEVLSDIRREAAQRLGAVGTVLRWEQPDDLPDRPLPPQRALHLYRIVREAISNALRHAHARRLRVRVRMANERLDIELTDDGAAGPAGADGTGMRSMRERADRLDGRIDWLPGTEGGTKVLLSMPLDGVVSSD